MQTLEEKQQDGMTGAGPETEFHTELFGFNRVEVLSYIERISAANAEKARALEDTIAALQKDLTGVRRQGSTLAQKAKQVYGVEIVPQAIEDAKNNAKLNGITNAQFFVGKAEEVLPQFYENAKKTENITDDTKTTGRTDMLRPDVIVVDPPRKGCDEKCLDTMLAMSPERIVYVSCDSATLARDLKILCEEKYELMKWQAFDQFSHTTHVETVVLLSKEMVDSRKVKVDFSLENMDLSEFKGKATYEQIKAYVLEQTGLKVSSLYIAQIKKKCGLDVGENFNLSKSENARQPQCTPEKEEAIMQAFKHFGMI